jgi:hypothetical protein
MMSQPVSFLQVRACFFSLRNFWRIMKIDMILCHHILQDSGMITKQQDIQPKFPVRYIHSSGINPQIHMEMNSLLDLLAARLSFKI